MEYLIGFMALILLGAGLMNYIDKNSKDKE